MISNHETPDTGTQHSGPETQIPTPNSQLPTPKRTWTLRIVGTLVFVALLIWFDLSGTLPFEGILSTLAGANPLLVGLSIALYIPFLIVKSARWCALCADMKMPIHWADAWRIYAIGLAAGTFTPGQAGDVLKSWYLQRMGYPLGRAFGSAVLDRLFDVAGLAVLGLVGVLVYGSRFASQVPALAVIVLLCALAAALFAWGPARGRLKQYVSGRLLRFGSMGDTTPNPQTWSLRPITLLSVVLLTTASFATSVFRVWLLAAALGITLGPLEVSGFVGLTTAAALVPVTVGGVGTRDVAATLALGQLGYAAADAIALSTLILLLNFAQAVIGWVVWLRYKVK